MNGTATAVLPTLREGFDRHVRVVLLGLQCRDVADGRVVSEGLQLVLHDLWRAPHARLSRALTPNRSGVFALNDFPGIRHFLTPQEADNDGLVAFDGFGSPVSPSSPDAPRFRLTVHDRLGRYVDLALTPTLGQGLWGPVSTASSQGVQPHVPLYSSATRTPPSAWPACAPSCARPHALQTPSRGHTCA
jgi:hypothetical protein